ncbi:MAG: hypothetical protein JRN15_05090 [Nitrososphaerota archaeon]|jgi:hypothetical protein|nr:hypothetical protein [Nitrososphaerota archaeon]
MNTVPSFNKASISWMYQVLIAFIVTAFASAYFGYLMPGSPLPLYQVAIIVLLEAIVFVGWGRVSEDTF